MKTQAKIKQACDRFEDVLRKKPAAGRFSTTTTVRTKGGMTCEIEEGPWKLAADMPEAFGGENSAPGPSTYGRAAMASCVAMGIVKQFANAELPLGDVQVDVESDVDMAERTHPLTPFRSFRLRVDVKTSAPEADAKRLIDAAITGSVWCGNARTAFDVPAETIINGKRASG